MPVRKENLPLYHGTTSYGSPLFGVDAKTDILNESTNEIAGVIYDVEVRDLLVKSPSARSI